MMKKTNKQTGITLVALVITIKKNIQDCNHQQIIQ